MLLLNMVCPSIKFTEQAKRKEETWSEKKNKTSVLDSYLMLILELTDKKIKITVTIILRAFM